VKLVSITAQRVLLHKALGAKLTAILEAYELL